MHVVGLSAWKGNDAGKSQIVRYVWLMCVIFCLRMVQVCVAYTYIIDASNSFCEPLSNIYV